MKKAVVIGITLLLLMSGMLITVNGSAGSENPIQTSSSPQPETNALISHDPIRINSNADFDAAHGVTGGSGTQADPYIIENYDIDAQGGGNAIYIGNTTAYFIVRNCTLYNASQQQSWPYLEGAGVTLYNVTNSILDNNKAKYNQFGIYFDSSTNNIISNNSMFNNGDGIYISSSNNNSISTNSIFNNSCGICLSSSTNHSIYDNCVKGNKDYGVYIEYYSDRNNILNNSINTNKYGIYLKNSKRNVISRNTANFNNKSGIYLEYSEYNTISNNTANFNNESGTYLDWNSDGNILSSNSENFNKYGICFDGPEKNTLTNNIINNNSYGIYLASSCSNVMADNRVNNNSYGICLYSSSSNTLKRNAMENNNIFIAGSSFYNWNTNNIEITNTVNGKPVYYWKNRTDGTVPSGAGEVILSNCTNVVVENQDLDNGTVGIELGFSDYNTIIGNNIRNNHEYGIYLYYCYKNSIYHNNFINNSIQSYGEDSWHNYWNASYPIGGNYWSDYSGNDSLQGPNQNEKGSDGFGDLAYYKSINYEDVIDYYPLMIPYGSKDRTIPKVSIIYPSNDSWVSPNFIVIWNGSDSVTGINHYEIKRDNASWENVAMNTSCRFNELSEGNHTIYVKGVDAFGNENISSVLIKVDATLPKVHITEPENASIFNESSVTVKWNGSDSLSGISGFWYAILDKKDAYEIYGYNESETLLNWKYIGLNTSYNFSSLSDGNFTVYIKTIDKVGNANITSVSFTVDTTPPTVNIIDPVDGFVSGSDTVTVRWSGSDYQYYYYDYYYGEEWVFGSGIDLYEIRIDEGTWNNTGENTTYSFSNLSEGQHTAYIRATDRAGNKNTETVTFTVDLSKPSIEITSPSDDAVFGTGEVTAWWIGNDSISKIGHYEVRVDSGPWQDVGTNDSYFFRGLSDGFHTIDVKAVDIVGNANVTRVTFSVGYGIISGKVVDENGNPVVNATVTLDSGESGITDENGVFRIVASKGAHTVTIDKTGYEEKKVDTSVQAGETTDLSEVSLPASSNANSEMDLTGLWIFIGILGAGAIVFILLVYKGVIDPEKLMRKNRNKKRKKTS